MTAGRRFWISPPIDGSKLTHQTSPRFIRDVPDRGLRPLVSLSLPAFVRRHCPVGVGQVVRNHVRPDQAFDELADLLSPDHPMKALIDLLIHGNRQFLVQESASYVSDTYLIGVAPRESRKDAPSTALLLGVEHQMFQCSPRCPAAPRNPLGSAPESGFRAGRCPFPRSFPHIYI